MKSFRTIAFAFVLVGVSASLPGCGFDTGPLPKAVPGGGPTPTIVNDLSSISKATPVGVLPPPAVASNTPSVAPSRVSEALTGMKREIGTERQPAEEQLLNPKAAEFATFARVILDRLYFQLRVREAEQEISAHKVPDDLEPVVITATLSPDGQLKELTLEQHSGKGVVDRMMIDACKKAVWYRNPPREALSADGTYKLRIQGRLENFASMDGRNWTFKTYLGIAIL